ncbi:MAG TPA: hypothetical protein VH087_03335 [Thermoanaerobaculia bacterium]|nr:hypothetical protein [Thermoanaerobaculia bacterium]
MSTDFLAHVRNSKRYRSFRSEMRVDDVLERLGWKTRHSPDYIDVRELKDREMDVSATRTWRRERKGELHVAHLNLVIECKGIHKETLLLAKMRRSAEADRLYHHWLGLDDDDLRNEIGTVAQEAGFDAVKVLRRFEAMAYPRGRAVVYPLLVNAPRAPIRASAIGEAEHDEEEKSLIRKAMLQLFSALQGTVATIRQESLTQLHDDLQQREKVDHLDYALEQIQSAATSVYLFHPIVVVDTKLVTVDHDGELAVVEWARVERARMASNDRRWLDVVSSEHFQEYAAQLTKWYSRSLGRIAEPA